MLPAGPLAWSGAVPAGDVSIRSHPPPTIGRVNQNPGHVDHAPGASPGQAHPHPGETHQLPPLPSLTILLAQVATERRTMNAHAESLDSKAGVVLGFAGVLVGLGATASAAVTTTRAFQIGLILAVVSAVLAAWAFLPRRYPVLEVGELRQSTLTASPEETRLELLDTQIEMIRETATLLQHKGWRVRASVGCLAVAAALVVAGILSATGGQLHA